MAVYSFDGPAVLADPGPMFRKMRSEGPFVRGRFPVIGEVWVATTQSAAAAILKDAETFTMRKPDGRLAALRWWMPPVLRALSSSMITADGPEHRRLRGVAEEAFRRRSVQTLEPRIQALAAGFADDLFSGGKPADLVARFARLLPLAAIAELLGLPESDRPLFLQWSAPLLDVRGPVTFARMLGGLWQLKRYLEQRIVIARREGHDGLLGHLASIEADGRSLSPDETTATVFLLLTAGFETTTHLISGAAFEVLSRPGMTAWLREDSSRMTMAVEEFLRFVSPVQSTKPRYVRRDTVVEGVRLRAGEQVMVLLGSANRDPSVIENPDDLDLARKPNRHVAFGAGEHFCLGHQLARLECRVGLQVLLERHPGLRLAVEPQSVKWRPRAGLRAIESLPVTD